MSHTVVLVDDVPEIRKILRLILEHAGPFAVVGEGCDGNEAATLAADLQPDLLVMDVEMRGGPSGWDILPKIRETAPRTAVVILSGSAADPLQLNREVMADAVLEKGMPPQELNDALLAVIRGEWAPAGAAVRESAEPDTTGAPAAIGASPAPSTELDELRREVSRLSDELSGFASIASHDLAQPLQVAYGYLEMVRSEFADGMDETAVAWIDNAIGSLERMRQLVQDILAFARTGNREITPEPVDLGDAVAAAAVEVAPMVDERSATLHLAPDLPTASGKRDHVVIVLAHLLTNAVRFVPAGTPPVVHVAAHDGGAEWIVEVADNGPGVDPAIRDRVFDLFYRGPKSANAGTGLGLAICRKLVNRMHGRIWVDDRSDGASGASVRFALPKGGTETSSLP